MPKNKNKKTSFYFYAKEYADRYNCGIKDAIEQSYPGWKSLTDNERAPYEQKLVEWKESQKLEKEATSEIDSKELIGAIKIEETFYGTDSILTDERKKLMDELKAKMQNIDVEKQRWYFIKFQTFCKTQEDREEDCFYLLAEVGVIEYSLELGITNEYHKFIKPEKIPIGYASQCMEKSKNYHQIPLLNFSLAISEYDQIYDDILRFVQPRECNNFYSPVFCLNDDYNETKAGLKWLHSKYDRKNSLNLSKYVIDLQTLVMMLVKHKNQEISFNSATDLLTSYHFDYSTDSRCEYHEQLGISYCALGYAKRYSYLISDHMSPIYEIKLEPGKHLPIEKVHSTVVHLDDSDFHSTTYKKLKLKASLQASSNSRIYDPVASRTDIRYSSSNSIGKTEMSTAHSIPRNKVADRFLPSKSNASFTEKPHTEMKTSLNMPFNNITEENKIKIDNDDDGNRSDASDGPDTNWSTVQSNNSVTSKSSFNTSRGRGSRISLRK